MLTMAPIAQPYSQDTYGMGDGVFLLWGGQKVDLELIVWSSFSPSSSSLSMRRCLSRHAATSIVAPTPVSSRLSRTAADCHFLLLVVVVVVVVTIMIAIVVVVVVVAPS